MACVAVLIPCHNGSAEVLPGNVSADDVLQVCVLLFARTLVYAITSGPHCLQILCRGLYYAQDLNTAADCTGLPCRSTLRYIVQAIDPFW